LNSRFTNGIFAADTYRMPDAEKCSTIVLIKQVPQMDRVKFDVEQRRVDRSSAKRETNPFDLNALEAAVKIKEKLAEG